MSASRPHIIGLLGGSFNPAHAGHVHVSREAMRVLGLDGVWWLVSPQNPLKDTEGMASFAERFASAERVTQHEKRIHISDFEQAHGTQYTVDTVTALVRAYPHIRFVWLMGADNLAQLHRWRDWQQLFSLVHMAVYDRKPYTLKGLLGKAAKIYAKARVPARELTSHPLPAWSFIHGTRHPLSATFIRNLLGQDAFMGHNKDAVNGKNAAKRR